MSEMQTSLSITVIWADKMADSTRQEVIHLCNEAYGEDLERYLTGCNPDYHVLARICTSLVGHGMVATRWLQAGEGPLLRTAYVELVATSPGFRRKGIGAAVARKLTDEAAAQRFDLAALCPADTDLYSHLGWEFWQGPLFIRGSTEKEGNPRGLIATPEERVMVLRLPDTPPLDLSRSLTAEWRDVGELW